MRRPIPSNDPAQPGLVLDHGAYDLVTVHCGGGIDILLTGSLEIPLKSF